MLKPADSPSTLLKPAVGPQPPIMRKLGPCREECPAMVNIPKYINHIKNKEYDKLFYLKVDGEQKEIAIRDADLARAIKNLDAQQLGPVMNFIPSRLVSQNGHLFLDADGFQLPVPHQKAPYYQSRVGSEVIVGIRPNYIYDRLFAPDRIKGNTLRAVVNVVELLGVEAYLNVTAGSHNLTACVDAQTSARIHHRY